MAACLRLPIPAQAQQVQDSAATDQLARAHLLKQLIEINTTDSVGNVTAAAEACAKAAARRWIHRQRNDSPPDQNEEEEEPGGAAARDRKAQAGFVYRAP